MKGADKAPSGIAKTYNGVSGVDTMVLGSTEKFLKVKNQLSNILTATYGSSGEFITKNVYNDIVIPTIEDFNELGGATQGLKNKLLEDALVKYYDKKRNEKDIRKRMYSQILLVLDEKGKSMVEASAGFDALNVERDDPLQLFHIVEKVYLSSKSVNLVMGPDVKQEAKIEYERYYQKEDVNLLDFKKMLIAKRDNLVNLGVIGAPDESQLAMDFIYKANKKMYGEAVNALKNSVSIGATTYPNSIEKAYELLNNHIPTNNSNGNNMNTIMRRNIKNTAFYNEMKSDGHENVSNLERNANAKTNANADANNNNNKRNYANATDFKNRFNHIKCYNCGGFGHFADKCRKANKKRRYSNDNSTTDINNANKINKNNHSAYFANGFLGCNSNVNSNIVVWDTGASIHCIDSSNTELLLHSKVHKELQQVHGVNGIINVDAGGVLPVFGKCLIINNLNTNLISASQVETEYPVIYKRKQYYKVLLDHNTYLKFFYNAESKLYSTNINELLRTFGRCNVSVHDGKKSYKEVLVSTVVDNKNNYSKYELSKVEKVRNLLRALGYPSLDNLYSLIKNGGITNSDLTAIDIRNYTSVYGNDIAYIKGHMKCHDPVKRVSYEQSNDLKSNRLQNLHADISFFNNIMFLTTVVKPLDLVISTHLQNKSSQCIIDAFTEQINVLRSYDYEVNEIFTDNEANFRSIFKVNGVNLITTPSKEAIAENIVKTLKERVRSYLASLPYDLNQTLLIELVKCITTMLNVLPRNNKTTSSRELLTGIKLHYDDIKYEFGSYAQVYDRNSVKNNILHERSYGCILLYPCFNGYKSYFFYNPTTNTIITSNNFQILPIPTEMVMKLNELADGKDENTESNEDVSDKTHNDNKNVEINSNISNINENNTNTNNDDNISNNENPHNSNVINVLNDHINQKKLIDVSSEHVDEEMQMINENDDVAYVFNMSIKKATSINEKLTNNALVKEIEQLINKQVFEPISFNDIPDKYTSNIIPCITNIREKFDEKNILTTFKARICADGSKIDKAIYGEYTCPTITTESLMLILAHAASLRKHIQSLDVEGAYLECELKNPVYMRINNALSNIIVNLYPDYATYIDNGVLYVKLLRALYGLPQSGQIWYNHLINIFKSEGYTVSEEDPCVCTKSIGNSYMTLGVHGDDVLFSHEDERVINDEIIKIGKHFGNYKVSNPNKFKHLGMIIERNSNMDLIISMEYFIDEICNEFKIYKGVSNPNTADYFENDTSELVSEYDRKKYHSVICKLLFS